jgi:hypothetical protein
VSYVRYRPHVLPSHRYSYGALGASADFKATLDAEAKAEATSAGATNNQTAADNLVAGGTTAAQAKAYYDRYKRYIPKTTKADFKDFKSATKWGERALANYAKGEAKEWTSEVINKTASNYGLQGCIPDHLPKNKKEAAHEFVELAAAGGCAAAGIDPRLGVATANALYDGHLDTNDCKAIGGVAGAVAGAAACQTFGIPAPIGAFVGGELGKLAGGAVASIFGLGDDEYKKWLKKQKEIVKKIELEAEQVCYSIRKGYWDIFDKLIIEAELKWETLELSVGAKFDLRWFDPTPAFYEWIQQQYTTGSAHNQGYKTYVDGPLCETRCDSTVIATGTKPYITSHSDEQLRALLKKSNCPVKAGAAAADMCSYGCSFTFGCLYPRFANWKKEHIPTSARLYGSTQRVIDAYLAHGIEWLPPPSKPGMFGIKLPGPGERRVFCDYPSATKKDIKDKKGKYRQIWIDHLNELIQIEQRRIKNLQTVQVRVISDLIKTASTVAAQKKMIEIAAQQKAEQAAFIKRAAPKIIVAPGEIKQSIVNTGALVGGGALLGYGLWLL